jgi:hypothetical protein
VDRLAEAAFCARRGRPPAGPAAGQGARDLGPGPGLLCDWNGHSYSASTPSSAHLPRGVVDFRSVGQTPGYLNYKRIKDRALVTVSSNFFDNLRKLKYSYLQKVKLAKLVQSDMYMFESRSCRAPTGLDDSRSFCIPHLVYPNRLQLKFLLRWRLVSQATAYARASGPSKCCVQNRNIEIRSPPL